jgi:hypothetical protein
MRKMSKIEKLSICKSVGYELQVEKVLNGKKETQKNLLN